MSVIPGPTVLLCNKPSQTQWPKTSVYVAHESVGQSSGSGLGGLPWLGLAGCRPHKQGSAAPLCVSPFGGQPGGGRAEGSGDKGRSAGVTHKT